MSAHFSSFPSAVSAAYDQLKNWGADVPVNRWQGVETEGTFREVLFWGFEVDLERYFQSSGDAYSPLQWLRDEIRPNLPWADDHFAERVGGKPLNPGEQYKNWPHWTPAESEDIALFEGKFSHTYMERLWPIEVRHNERGAAFETRKLGAYGPCGTLDDAVERLREDPYTRQAYVPIWYPEDGYCPDRVPCSIGYFFIMRNNRLHMRYHIRSCDFNRYLRDDIYMAVRLQLWILEQLQLQHPESIWEEVTPGIFLMDIDSLHVIGGDFSVRT